MNFFYKSLFIKFSAKTVIKMFNFILSFILLFAFTGLIFPGSKSDFSFEHISLEDGLSQSTVNCIFQDSKGFLWFGTANGLNKYDGYSFTVYKHNPFDTNSLSNDHIRSIAEDREGNLWIGTENGLNKLDVNNKRFNDFNFNYNLLKNIPISSLHFDSDGNLWIGTFGRGIYQLKSDRKTLKNFINNYAKSDNSPGNFITSIYQTSDNAIWVSTIGSIARFDKKNETFSNYFLHTNEEWSYRNRVNSLFEVEPGILWVATEGNGLVSFDIKNKIFSDLSLEAPAAKVIYKDSKNNLWIGTYYSGLFFYDREDKVFKNISDENGNINLSDNSVISIHEDRSGILWFGTFLGGLNKYITSKKNFSLIRRNPDEENTLIDNVIYSVAKDINGNLWIGTTMGLSKLEKESKKFINYSAGSSGLEEDYITEIYQDKKNDIWILTGRNIYKYNPANNKFRKIDFILNDEWIPAPALSVLFEDSENNFWIGSRSYGLIKFDRKNEIFLRDTVIGDENVMTLYEDKKKQLLLGTANGLIIYDKKSKILKSFSLNQERNSLNNNIIFSIYEDENENLWIGTYGGGLNKFDKKENKFYYFSEAEGLPNNVVYSILPDDNNNLWLSTNKGICRFNIKNKSVRTFDVSDGLQSFEFNEGAAFKSKDGEMFFGGVNGLNRFYPSKITDNPYPPSVIITSIKNIDKELINSVQGNEFELSYNENFVSFEFVALDYTNPKKNKYAYKLEGFDKDWIFSGNRRYASYTNLEPGKYIFKVKGSNSDDVWNESGASFSFIINPPFWKTWWFFTLSALLVISLIFFIHKYRLKAKINKMVEIERLRKNIADDFHDELGHKLTKISLYSELMRRNLKEVLNGNEIYLKKINDAANNLYDDTKDFIWSIDPVKDTLYDLAVYLKDFGDELFDKTDIAFMVKEISGDLNVIKLPMDWKRQLILIYKEAMNNILRHSGCKNVELSVVLDNNQIFINLVDDGKGFSGMNGNGGRGLVNMKNRATRLGGELIIETSEGYGTRITFHGTVKTILN